MLWWKATEDNLNMPFMIQREENKNAKWKFLEYPYVIPMFTLLFLIVIGLALGLSLPPSSQLSGPYRLVSNILGYTYFAAWSLSFYPQVFLNWRRKNTCGLSYDFELYNLLGFTTYATFNLAFYAVPSIQEAYRDANNGNSNKVALNDVFFAVHALVITLLTIIQIHYYDGRQIKVSRTCLALVALAVSFSLIYAIIVLVAGTETSTVFSWLKWLYFLSYIKMGITTVKYIPQVILNHNRKSTVGWSIMNVLLDLLGGTLSVLQLILDCQNTNDWSGINGDPVKFGLGFVSILFDFIFMFQHYILFPPKKFKIENLNDENQHFLEYDYEDFGN